MLIALGCLGLVPSLADRGADACLSSSNMCTSGKSNETAPVLSTCIIQLPTALSTCTVHLLSSCTLKLHCPPALSPCTVHLHCPPAMNTCHVQPRSNRSNITALSTTCLSALSLCTVHLRCPSALSTCAAHRHCPPELSPCTVYVHCPHARPTFFFRKHCSFSCLLQCPGSDPHGSHCLRWEKCKKNSTVA